MKTGVFTIDAIDIISYVVFALIIIIPTLRRIYRNQYFSSNQKYMYAALTILLPPIGLLVYYMRSQQEIKKKHTAE